MHISQTIHRITFTDAAVRLAAVMAAFLMTGSAASAATIRGAVPSERFAGATSPVIVWVEGAPRSAEAIKQPLIMSQKNMRFQPPFLVAVTGQVVQFPNEDNVAHSVYSDSTAKQFDLGIYDEADRRSVILTKPGIVEVRCALHRQMKSTVFVVPSPHYAAVDASGGFEIRDVPAGKYKIVAWAGGKDPIATEVTVAGDTDVTFGSARGAR